MKRYVIRARAIATDDVPVEDKLLVVSGQKIESILPATAAKRFASHDFVGTHRYLVFPGLVDIHCHGGGGGDPATLGGVLAAAFFHASHGTTSMLLSGFYPRLEDISRIADLIKKARPSASLRLLGLHLEGPYLNPQARGSIPESCIHPADPHEIGKIIAAAGGELRMMTLAPELPGIGEIITRLVNAHVTVAIGHSLATAEQTRAAVDWGARVVTHLGNAMAPFHQRDPGMVGVALAEKRLTAEVIADGVHLAPETLAMYLRAKVGEVAMVSDCRWIGGLPEGSRAELEGETLEVKDGAARTADGTLAGAVQPLWAGVKTLGTLPGFSPWQAARLAAANPARVLGARGLGRITIGGRADLVLCGPDFTVQRVFVGGTEVYHASFEAPLIS